MLASRITSVWFRAFWRLFRALHPLTGHLWLQSMSFPCVVGKVKTIPKYVCVVYHIVGWLIPGKKKKSFFSVLIFFSLFRFTFFRRYMCACLLGTKYFDFDRCSTVRVIKSCEYFDNEWVPDIWKKNLFV